jgi:hypothetical protein
MAGGLRAALSTAGAFLEELLRFTQTGTFYANCYVLRKMIHFMLFVQNATFYAKWYSHREKTAGE